MWIPFTSPLLILLWTKFICLGIYPSTTSLYSRVRKLCSRYIIMKLLDRFLFTLPTDILNPISGATNILSTVNPQRINWTSSTFGTLFKANITKVQHNQLNVSTHPDSQDTQKTPSHLQINLTFTFV